MKKNVSAVRAQSFLHADFAGPLLHRYQHDVHQSDAADAKRQRADKSQQHFEGYGYDAEFVEVLLEVGDKDGAMIVGAEIVMGRQHGAHYARQLLVVLAFVVHEDARDVLGVVEIAHGAERNDDHAVVVVVAALHFVAVDSDYLEADAVDADALSKSRLTGEETATGFVADYGHAGTLKLVFFAQAATGGYLESANTLVHGKHACQKKIGVGAGVVLNGRAVLAVEDWGYSFDHGDFVADVVHVGEFESDFAAGFGPSGLEGGASREGSDYVHTPGAEDEADGALKAGAEGQQDYHGGDAPGHSEHSQSGTAAVVAHGAIGLF